MLGSISGSGQLIKNGTGTVNLQAINSYTGGTVINGGTLVVTSSGGGTPGAPGSAITINSTGTLVGSRSV